MLAELAEMLEKTGKMDEIVLSQYSLKNGMYIKLNRNGDIADHLIVNKNTPKDSELYSWFKTRDYYSKLVSMNKPVDSKKKIHSNNIYTMFIKCEILPEVGNKKPLNYTELNEAINRYFDKIQSKPEKVEKAMLEDALVPECNSNECDFCKNLFINSVNKIMDSVKNSISNSEFSIKEYVKVFIESDSDSQKDIDNYILESKRYNTPKIFNTNGFNISVDGNVYGTSNENFGLNQKKPYLEMKSTRYKAPYRISINDAFKNHKLVEWVENAKSEESKMITRFNVAYDYDFSTRPEMDSKERGYCFQVMPTTSGTVVVDSNIIPRNIKELDDVFKYSDYIGLKNYELKATKERGILESYISKAFFKNQIQYLYYDDDYKPKGADTYTTNMMKLMKQPMVNYFRKGISNSLNYIMDKATLGIIKNNISNDDTKISDVIVQMNLRLNLLKYFNIGGKANMGDILQNIRKKVNDKVNAENCISIETDEEYFYCVGQLTYYLCSLSEAGNKNHSMYNGILNAKSYTKLNKVLMDLYKVYNYKISSNSKRFSHLFEMVKGYEPNSRFNEDMVLCGILADNVIYKKGEEE